MPPAKKKLSPEDEKLAQEVKDELEKPDNAPDDDKDSDADTDKDKKAAETESSQVNDDDDDDKDSAAGKDESGESDSDPDLVWTDSPCAICFPEGWPAEEEGAHVNCPHGHAIAYGQRVQISKDRALELGFVEHTS